MCLFLKQTTEYEMRISDWSSDVCSSDLTTNHPQLWLSSGTPVRASLTAPAWGTVADMLVIAWPPSSLLTLPEQAQQQLEQVDKIEIERQRAHHGQLVRPLGSSIGQILALQALGVPSGEPRKHQHAGDRED